MNSTPQYALLGGGRVARHFRYYLQLEGLPTTGWTRDPHCDLNSHDEPNTEERLRATVKRATHVLLLVSDDAIAPLLRRYGFLHEHRLVHCAGALSLPGVAGAHPLMTFGRDRYTLEDYQRIPFMIEKGYAFNDLFPGLSNPNYTISPEQKGLYHALCVVAGNFPQMLWQAVGARIEHDLDLPRDVMAAYLAQNLANALADPDGALTGPLARGDAATLERNLTALGPGGLQDLYRSFIDFHGREARPELRQNAS
ncbi:MAG: DUF2520 domain-containing protein [Pseudomonadota bacterium]